MSGHRHLAVELEDLATDLEGGVPLPPRWDAQRRAQWRAEHRVQIEKDRREMEAERQAAHAWLERLRELTGDEECFAIVKKHVRWPSAWSLDRYLVKRKQEDAAEEGRAITEAEAEGELWLDHATSWVHQQVRQHKTPEDAIADADEAEAMNTWILQTNLDTQERIQQQRAAGP